MNTPQQDIFPRTEADRVAEAKTEAAWAKQIGDSVAQVAVAAEAEVTSSSLLLPSRESSTKPVQETAEHPGYITTDRRTITPEKIEADERQKMEALKAPLAPSEIASAVDRLVAFVPESPKQPGYYSSEQLGDFMGLFRLQDMLRDGVLPYATDTRAKDAGVSVKERLENAEAALKDSRSIDAETRGLKAAGYSGNEYYAVARALATYDALVIDPANTRTNLLRDTPNDAVAAEILKPLTVPEGTVIATSETYDPDSRYTLAPTPPHTFNVWLHNNLQTNQTAAA